MVLLMCCILVCLGFNGVLWCCRFDCALIRVWVIMSLMVVCLLVYCCGFG